MRKTQSPVLVALVKQGLRDARMRTAGFAYLFAAYAYIQPVGYRHTYRSAADRAAFAHSFGTNVGLRLIYGRPHDIQTTAGYTAWRVGGVLALAAAAFGLLASVRATRTEEDSGRSEFLLAGPISRLTMSSAALCSVMAGIAGIWLAEWLALSVAGIGVGGAAYLAVATISVAVVTASLAAVGGQFASTRRGAFGVGGAVVAMLVLLRFLGDTVQAAAWLSWLSPLGWAERMQPLTHPHPVDLLLPVVISCVLTTLAGRLQMGRDMGSGLLPVHDSAAPRLLLLRTPTLQALRAGIGGFTTWFGTVAVMLFIFGVVSHSLTDADVPKNVRDQLAKLGSGSITTPTGYLAFLFLFVTVALCLFTATQISALRQDEAQHVETLLAQPVSRRRWLSGRLVLAAAVATGISLVGGLAAWAGAAAAHVHLSLPRFLEAGANALPVTGVFLGLGALAYAVLPRAAAGITYALIAVSFLWQLVGALLEAPQWVLDLSPFTHVALVPSQTFQPIAAIVLLGIGLLAALGAITAFTQRDMITE